MKKLKKILSRQFKNFTNNSNISSHRNLNLFKFFDNKSGSKFVEAKFMWELYHLDTRGIVYKIILLYHKFYSDPKSISKHITTNIDGFITKLTKIIVR